MSSIIYPRSPRLTLSAVKKAAATSGIWEKGIFAQSTTKFFARAYSPAFSDDSSNSATSREGSPALSDCYGDDIAQSESNSVGDAVTLLANKLAELDLSSAAAAAAAAADPTAFLVDFMASLTLTDHTSPALNGLRAVVDAVGVPVARMAIAATAALPDAELDTLLAALTLGTTDKPATAMMGTTTATTTTTTASLSATSVPIPAAAAQVDDEQTEREFLLYPPTPRLKHAVLELGTSTASPLPAPFLLPIEDDEPYYSLLLEADHFDDDDLPTPHYSASPAAFVPFEIPVIVSPVQEALPRPPPPPMPSAYTLRPCSPVPPEAWLEWEEAKPEPRRTLPGANWLGVWHGEPRLADVPFLIGHCPFFMPPGREFKEIQTTTTTTTPSFTRFFSPAPSELSRDGTPDLDESGRSPTPDADLALHVDDLPPPPPPPYLFVPGEGRDPRKRAWEEVDGGDEDGDEVMSGNSEDWEEAAGRSRKRARMGPRVVLPAPKGRRRFLGVLVDA